MKVEVTDDEAMEIAKAMMLAAQAPEHLIVDWEVIAKFLAKIDRP